MQTTARQQPVSSTGEQGLVHGLASGCLKKLWTSVPATAGPPSRYRPAVATRSRAEREGARHGVDNPPGSRRIGGARPRGLTEPPQAQPPERTKSPIFSGRARTFGPLRPASNPPRNVPERPKPASCSSSPQGWRWAWLRALPPSLRPCPPHRCRRPGAAPAPLWLWLVCNN